MRVISVETPSVSSSEKESDWMCAISSCRSPVDVPMAARAAKYCAVKLQQSPTAAIRTRIPKRLTMYGRLLPAIPTSMIWATTIGTRRSNTTSRSLNKGAMMLSFL